MINQDKPTPLTAVVVNAIRDAIAGIKFEMEVNRENNTEARRRSLREYQELLQKIEADHLDVSFYSRAF